MANSLLQAPQNPSFSPQLATAGVGNGIAGGVTDLFKQMAQNTQPFNPQTAGTFNTQQNPLGQGSLNLQPSQAQSSSPSLQFQASQGGLGAQPQTLGLPNTVPTGIANTQAAPSSQIVNPPTQVGESAGTRPTDLGSSQNTQGALGGVGALYNNPQSQQLLQQQSQTLQRLEALQGQLAQTQVPSGAEVGLQNDINSLTNQINNLNPQQYLKDNPALANAGITNNQLLGQVSQADLPLTQALANLTLSKSVLGQQRQIAGYQLGAESTGLQNTASIQNQIRQLTMFGGLPEDIASAIIQKQLFPPVSITQNIAGQPIGITEGIGGQLNATNIGFGGTGQSQGGIGGGVGGFGSSIGGQNNTNIQQGIIGGINLQGGVPGAYATDPQYAQKIGNIYNTLPQFSSADQMTQYIQNIAPGSPLTGQMIMASSTKYGIDPKVLIAQAQEESKFGTQGAATNTFNPGNVGNVDSGATRSMGSWQSGLDAQASELALRQTGQSQAPSSINIAGLPVQVDHLSDGTSYINSDKVDDKILPFAKSQAPQMGIPVLSTEDVAKTRALDVTTQNLSSLNGIMTNILSSGFTGRVQGLTLNPLQALTQSNPDIASFNVYRDTAINTIQALAGGSGSGFRLNQAEIDTAVSNIPTINDNLETAQSKLQKLGGFLNNWKQELLPGSKPIDILGRGDASQGGGSNDPLGIL